MKKSLFTIIVLALLASCSVKTNEEKARELIEPELKANMIKPESFEIAQIQLDSCFSDDSRFNPDAFEFGMKVFNLCKEYRKYTSEAENAESYMTIYAPSYGYQSAHSQQQHNKYKAEMEKALRKAAAVKDNIINLYKDNKKFIEGVESAKHEFTGWAASVAYRAETAGGMKMMDGVLFFLNKDLTKITHRFTKEDINNGQLSDLEDLKYEFEDDLREIFEDEIRKNN